MKQPLEPWKIEASETPTAAPQNSQQLSAEQQETAETQKESCSVKPAGPWTDEHGTVHMADGRTLERTRIGYQPPPQKTIKEVVASCNIVLGYDRKGRFAEDPQVRSVGVGLGLA